MESPGDIGNPVPVDSEIEMEDGEDVIDELGLGNSKKRSKATTSDVWPFFTKIGPDATDGIERAKCNACNSIYKCGGKLYGTSSLRRHKNKCNLTRHADVGQMMIDMQGKLAASKID